jgi:hypothetical protein
MSPGFYRYTFSCSVPQEDVEASLLLALLAVESLHGEAQVRLDAAHFLDPHQRGFVIDASTAVGRDVNRLFVGFVRKEFGEDAFRVDRVHTTPRQEPQPAGAVS